MSSIQLWWVSVEAWWKPVILGLATLALVCAIAMFVSYMLSKRRLTQQRAASMRSGILKLTLVLAGLPIVAAIPTFGERASLIFEAVVGVFGLAYAVIIYWRGAPVQKIVLASVSGVILIGTAAFPEIVGRGFQITLAAVALLLMSLYPIPARVR